MNNAGIMVMIVANSYFVRVLATPDTELDTLFRIANALKRTKKRGHFLLNWAIVDRNRDKKKTLADYGLQDGDRCRFYCGVPAYNV